MSLIQKRLLILWAMLLSAFVCLAFLPITALFKVLLMIVAWGLIGAIAYAFRPRAVYEINLNLENLPDPTWRQPVVLVCGDLPQAWPEDTSLLIEPQGCWVRIKNNEELSLIAHEILKLRPDWGRQLSVMVSVCPQQHTDLDLLTSHLLNLRWQISQLRRALGHTVPLILNTQVGSSLLDDMIWQSTISEQDVRVWQNSSAPSSIALWMQEGGESTIQQQILINNLMDWFHQHINAVFCDEKADFPIVRPSIVLWGIGPTLTGSLATSLWTHWLTQYTAMEYSELWYPSEANNTNISLFPDFILPLLPEGHGLTPCQRTFLYGLSLFTLASIIAVYFSGWNNNQLINRVNFDINYYYSIAMDDFEAKLKAVNILRQDAKQLDEWTREGAPMKMTLGLYQGEHLRKPLLEAIRTYTPPPPPPEPAPKTIRLDSMSLFDSGKAALKDGSTKMLVNSLVGIKAKPGWLIVVAGHTDNVGDAQFNQILSLKRAESVRVWMRDTGDVPESCFAVQGYGASRPVASNDTADGRALNRRVEISLVPQADACQLLGTP